VEGIPLEQWSASLLNPLPLENETWSNIYVSYCMSCWIFSITGVWVKAEQSKYDLVKYVSVQMNDSQIRN